MILRRQISLSNYDSDGALECSAPTRCGILHFHRNRCRRSTVLLCDGLRAQRSVCLWILFPRAILLCSNEIERRKQNASIASGFDGVPDRRLLNGYGQGTCTRCQYNKLAGSI